MQKEKIIGIYKITNNKNGKVYIGQSKDIYKRWYLERTYKDKSNINLFNAFIEDGIDNFSFEILMRFKQSPFIKKYLDKFEILFGNRYDARNPEKGYNIREFGHRGDHHPSSIAKCREAQIGEKNSFYGKKHSECTILKMSSKQQGKNNPNYGKKGKDNPNYGKKGVTKEVICVETGIKYRSVLDASKLTGIGKDNIRKCCLGQALTAGNFSWNYVNSMYTKEERNNMYISYIKRLKERSDKGNRYGRKKVKCIELHRVFESCATAATEIECSANAITMCCKGNQLTAGGYHWEYVNE